MFQVNTPPIFSQGGVLLRSRRWFLLYLAWRGEEGGCRGPGHRPRCIRQAVGGCRDLPERATGRREQASYLHFIMYVAKVHIMGQMTSIC